MQRPSRKQFWALAVSVLILAGILIALPPVRLQYHKWQLESVKAKKTRLLAARPSGIDKFWLHLTGDPISGQELDAIIRKHEDALVRLGFLDQAKLPAHMVSACPQTLETLDALRTECPWYHAETLSDTNLVVTACPHMMHRWRKRARELGW